MSKLVLVVDDEEEYRNQLVAALEDEYQVLTAKDGEEALNVIDAKSKELSVVVLNLDMPKKNGYEVLLNMKTKGYLEYLPVLVESSDTDIKTEENCFQLGASDFIRKPINPKVVKYRVNVASHIFQSKNELEERVKNQTKQLKAQYNILLGQAKAMELNNQKIIDILGTVVECRNLESGDHIRRIKAYTRILAEQLSMDYPEYGLTKEQIEMIVNSSALHDIGKIAIPDEILLKPGKLTKEEFDYMKSHTIRGGEILQNIKGIWGEEYEQYCYDICRYHHEKYDGKGYPEGLVGEQIPLSAQLVSLADVYDALVEERCYKEAYTKEQAYGMILQGECGMFSPKLLEAFQKARPKIEEVD